MRNSSFEQDDNMGDPDARPDVSAHFGDAVGALAGLPLSERIDAIAEDVRQGTDAYRSLSPDDLAEAVGLSLDDTSEWNRFDDIAVRSVEELLDEGEEAEILTEFLIGRVSEERKAAAEALMKSYADNHNNSLLDLTFMEKEIIEEGWHKERLSSGADFQMVETSIFSSNGFELMFQAYVNCTGEVDEVLTPYDQRDGRFVEPSKYAEYI